MSDNEHEHDPATPPGVTMRRGGTGQQGTEDTPAGTSASVNQLMILINNLQAEMSAMRVSHAEELEQIQHQHDTLAIKISEDTKSTSTKPPVTFDTIEAPKHRSHIELIRASRRKSVVPSKKLKRSDSDPDDSSDEETPEVLKVKEHKPIIDGRPLTVRSTPLDIQSCTTVRLYDQKDRASLTGEAKQAFIDAATGHVLTKNNKLRYLPDEMLCAG